MWRRRVWQLVPMFDRSFLDVEETIWTYNSTRGSTLNCRKDVRLASTQSYIRFERSHFINRTRKWVVKDLEGNYSASALRKNNTADYRSIYVGEIGYSWRNEELLMYQSKDNKCGVFVIFTRGKPLDYYSVDLRVKNSSVHEGPSAECVEEFSKLLRKRKSRVLYSPECQSNVINHKEIFIPTFQ